MTTEKVFEKQVTENSDKRNLSEAEQESSKDLPSNLLFAVNGVVLCCLF
jgi:hypothetical protein